MGVAAPPARASGDSGPYYGTIVLDAGPFAAGALSERAHDLLFRYLASDAAWRVTRFGAGAPGTVVAVKREHVEGELPSEDEIAAGLGPRPPWRWTRNGFVTAAGADGSVRTTRLLIRLSPDAPPDPSWRDAAAASTAALGAARLPLRLFRGEGGALESDLVLEGPGLDVEIFESDGDPQRAFTAAAVAEARGLLQAAAAQAASGRADIDRARLTPGSVLAAERPSMRIHAENGQPGRLAVSGYVNPGRAGWIYLRLLDATTGAALEAPEESDAIEYAGWSDDPREQFYFDLPAQCRTPARTSPVAARFELWFVAAAGGAAVRRIVAIEQPVACASD